MLKKRIIICLDVRDGKTTKGIKFKGNIDIGDPVEMAEKYYRDGVDELVFYDITASAEKRGIMIDVVERVAERIFIPFSVGGGIASVQDMRRVLLAGAEKISVNSQAVKNPSIIEEGASIFGRQCIVLGMDAARDPDMPSGYRVFINGGRTATELDALAWAKQAERLGAGEFVLNSIDADGTKNGYEITLTKMISDNVGVPVVASGGAGKPEHLEDVFKNGNADAALIASMVHYGDYTVQGIKEYLAASGVPMRM
ncbi:MAG: imidazole glycerol phosphate synthase subunit HisF [Spirochaetia bacterium]|nr:imidazole glycerol phosphate synthase subunit HisF [Spirochaetia bacterium]MBR4797555.1 imidazole glycerol phosphate synthase subunit HisF [Spirochaetia bacterium]MBR5016972.1 imidazole glycerol phosphate synthase subunit HisF [Spirochaetia bacterium]MBR5915006.1 imidazole glycerol phosphate synthase subunit HisF [Spirochaetia bacterium]